MKYLRILISLGLILIAGNGLTHENEVWKHLPDGETIHMFAATRTDIYGRSTVALDAENTTCLTYRKIQGIIHVTETFPCNGLFD